MGPGEAEGMVEAHAAVPRRPGHGGLRVVVKAETESVSDENCDRPTITLRSRSSARTPRHDRED